MFKLNIEFRTDGVRLRVQARILFLYAKHLIDEAIKFPLALSENSELAFVEEAFVPVGFRDQCCLIKERKKGKEKSCHGILTCLI